MKVGLALSGGAARGLAHIGVIKVLLEHQIPLDAVAGTSAGAIIGGAYAAGLTVPQMVQLSAQIKWGLIGRFAFSRFGLLSTEPMQNYIRQNFPVKTFEETIVPFACVATDLNTGEGVVMKERGDLAAAIAASCAIPGIYVPVLSEDKRQLIDGGIAEFVPVNTARSLGADVVIGVEVNFDDARFVNAPQTAFGVFFQAAMMMLKTAANHQLNNADIIIRPSVGHLRIDEFGKAREFIAAGEKAALAA
ncbi:MAG: patatin-like phospholipase family protein, partial [Pyrinomonadaceae bacterium]